MPKPEARTVLRNTLITFLFFFTLPAFGEFDADHLSAVTRQGMDLWHVPGMSVAVVDDDEVLFQEGFGTTSINDGQAVNEHTLFAIASTTKAMVVSGILILVDDNKLSLDDPITRHIPELHFNDPSLTHQLSVRDLLAHRTGLPGTDFWTFFQDMSLEEQFALLPNVELAAPPRTRLIYQNTMYEIAGLLIERLSGQRWDVFLRERLWQPIGMQETYGGRDQISAEQAHVLPYFYHDDQLTETGWDFSAAKLDAAGSAWSSIHDMSLWAQFLLRGGITADGTRLISEDSFEQMFEPHQLAARSDFYPVTELTKPNWRSYGLGWFQQDFQGRKIDFHTGSLSGLIAIIGLDRANDKAIIVLGNRDHAEMRHALLWEVMDNRDKENRIDWNQAVFDLYQRRANEGEEEWQASQQDRLQDTQPSLALAAYTGQYQSNIMGSVQIEENGGSLLLKAVLRDLEMTHWHLDTFLVEHKSWGLRMFASFNIGPDGAVSSFELAGDTFQIVKEPDA